MNPSAYAVSVVALFRNATPWGKRKLLEQIDKAIEHGREEERGRWMLALSGEVSTISDRVVKRAMR